MRKFFGHVYKNETLFEKGRHILLLNWFGKERRRFHNMNVEALLSLCRSFHGSTAKKSTFSHPDARLGLPAIRAISKS